jgi:hypothetical protein
MAAHAKFDKQKKRLLPGIFKFRPARSPKRPRNWLGNKLDATKRSQMMFMDRDDIKN